MKPHVDRSFDPPHCPTTHVPSAASRVCASINTPSRTRGPCVHPARLAGALALAILLGTAPAGVAGAAPNSEARLAIHLLPHAANGCARPGATPPCSDIVSNGDTYPTLYYAYLLVTNADAVAGIAGVQCGLDYDGTPGHGVEVFGWTLCASMEAASTGWPASGGGNLITWDSSTRCQRAEPAGSGTGVVATAGYFYLAAYEADRLSIKRRPLDDAARVFDCAGASYTLEDVNTPHDPPYLGYAAFSHGAVSQGFIPCATAGPPIQCYITGPTSVGDHTTGNVYAAPYSPAGASYNWSVTGDGSIAGSATNPTVSITAGAIGAYTVAVRVSAGGNYDLCSRDVTVIAAPPTCEIQGPATARINEPYLEYLVVSSATITDIRWSITGNGHFSPGIGNPRSVTAGDAGAFELTAEVTTAGTPVPSTCRKTVTVAGAITPTCEIQGPSSVPTGASHRIYQVASHWPYTSLHWSITGDGTITSDPGEYQIQVTAGNIGAFELTSTIQTTVSVQPAICTKTVTVTPLTPPTCLVEGPTNVSEGALDQYFHVNPSENVANVAWSATGNGTVTGTPTGYGVMVAAGDPGTFDLTATITTSDLRTNSCTKTVTVDSLTCAINGAVPMIAGSHGNIYAAGPPRAGTTYLWQVSGDGTVPGALTERTVSIDAGLPGSVHMQVTITRNGIPRTCARDIAVVDDTPQPAGNQNAKLLLHLAPPTTTEPCGARGAPACNAAVTTGTLFPTTWFAYLMVADANTTVGVQGFECGIDYDAGAHSGVDIFNWTLCATTNAFDDGPNGPWPAAGSGTIIRWDLYERCQRTEPGGPGTGVSAAAGYFYLAAYSADAFRLTPRPVNNRAAVSNCASRDDIIGGTGFPPGAPSRLGITRFSAGGATPGYNPCGTAVPVRVTTWGSIKALYGS